MILYEGKLLHLLTLGCRDLGSSSLVVFKAVLIRYATKIVISRIHNTSNNALFQEVGLLAQSLAVLHKCMLLFCVLVQWHVLTGNVPSYLTRLSHYAPKIQQQLSWF